MPCRACRVPCPRNFSIPLSAYVENATIAAAKSCDAARISAQSAGAQAPQHVKISPLCTGLIKPWRIYSAQDNAEDFCLFE
ncbi:hypothetical protein EM595_2002 [Duffyella gerundensis]|uniref:Uncharacterized protein n=1 Tax=Duffyella gerundensis TaxID=1619313 RepID=A0A0U5LPE5_9GAMM|nr:hypothetical protein EM595_2002 [Duffyella gerundensis]